MKKAMALLTAAAIILSLVVMVIQSIASAR